eukprot:Lankesteria_metandrocarpae@DN10477_c0_g1_i1.p1
MAKKKSKNQQHSVNVSAVVLQSIGVVLLLLSVGIPSWLSNPSGLNYYPYARTWGLFVVTGRITQSHYESWETQCKIAATHMLDVSCVTPLCDWYTSKCAAYRLQTVVSYSVAGILLMVVPTLLVSIILSFRRSKKLMKWTLGLSVMAMVLPVAAIAAYIAVMGVSFDIVNSAGYYPVPQPSVGIFILGLAEFFLVCGFLSQCTRLRRVRKEMNYEEDMYYEAAMLRAEHGL